MSIPKVEAHHIDDLSMLDEVLEFSQKNLWYAIDSKGDAFVDNIDQFGTWKSSQKQMLEIASQLANFERPEFDKLPVLRSHTRQPYGWDDESVARLAPPVYKLFQYVNNTFFQNKLTIGGIPEEVYGSNALFNQEEYRGIPGWGQVSETDDAPVVWRAYTNAQPISSGRAVSKYSVGTGAGIHRDWDQPYSTPESDADDYFTLLICINKTWDYSVGNDIIFYETVPPTESVFHHKKRGYGFGKPVAVYGHEPGLVLLYPASALHGNKGIYREIFFDKDGLKEFPRKLVFRVRKNP